MVWTVALADFWKFDLYSWAFVRYWESDAVPQIIFNQLKYLAGGPASLQFLLILLIIQQVQIRVEG